MLKPYDLPLLPISFDAETELGFYKLAVDASIEIERLKQKLNYSPMSESFLQLVALSESVQSTKIEGSQVTFSDMLEDQVSEESDWEKIEVRNYSRAIKLGTERIKNGYPLTERLIRELHQVLMEDARGSVGITGEYRKTQNFIGPTKNIKDATYISPEPQKIGKYMQNLEFYINGHPYEDEETETIHPIINAAIIHAQFESIHPFLDGNGRLGRILIVLYLLQEKVIDVPIFFLSEELEKEQFKYYSLLNGIRAIKDKQADWKSWIEFFLQATIRMAKSQFNKLDKAETLYINGRTTLEQPSLQTIWFTFFRHPITTVKDIHNLTDLSPSTIRKGLKQLEEKQLIFGNDFKRNRRFYQYDLIRIMTD